MKPPVKAGEKEDIFKELLSYRESVFLICLGYTKDYHNAEELTQDIYVKVWEKLEKFNVSIQKKGWILRVARNRCIDNFRKERVKNLFFESKRRDLDSVMKNDTPEIIIQYNEDRESLKKCISSLPEKLRSVLILREYGENSCEEISKVLNIKLGTVYSRLNRAKARLIKLMEEING